jgi:hypothetical protein
MRLRRNILNQQKESVYNPNKIIVLVTGRAGTGKTTTCNLLSQLTDTLGYLDHININFSDSLKMIAEEQLDWDREKDPRGRRLLQQLGRVAREYNEDIWASKLLDKIQSFPYGFDFVFVGDWRFPNEEKFLRENSSYRIFTMRIDAKEREVLSGTPEYDDISEISLSGSSEEYDYFIENNDSMEILQKKLAKVLVDMMRTVQEER